MNHKNRHLTRIVRTPKAAVVKRPFAHYVGDMQHMRETVEKRIEIKVLVHSTTGLMMAVCDELKGFMVPGRSIREIERKLPGAIRDHFDLLGYEVGDVVVENSDVDDGFQVMPAAIIAQASLWEKRAP